MIYSSWTHLLLLWCDYHEVISNCDFKSLALCYKSVSHHHQQTCIQNGPRNETATKRLHCFKTFKSGHYVNTFHYIILNVMLISNYIVPHVMLINGYIIQNTEINSFIILHDTLINGYIILDVTLQVSVRASSTSTAVPDLTWGLPRARSPVGTGEPWDPPPVAVPQAGPIHAATLVSTESSRNGGTLGSTSCRCPAGWTDTCCNTSKYWAV